MAFLFFGKAFWPAASAVVYGEDMQGVIGHIDLVADDELCPGHGKFPGLCNSPYVARMGMRSQQRNCVPHAIADA